MKKKNKKQKAKSSKKPTSKTKKIFYVLLLTTLVLTSSIYFVISLKKDPVKTIEHATAYTQIKFESKELFTPLSITVDNLVNLRDQKIANIQATIIKKEKDAKVAKIEALFKRYNSPMQGYGELIYDRAAQCGGDYRVLIGIAGNESGLGRKPLKKYNPFGYLDGVQYSGWFESLNFLSCKIAQKFLKPCSNNLTCIVNKYGGSDTPKERWVNNVTYFVNQL